MNTYDLSLSYIYQVVRATQSPVPKVSKPTYAPSEQARNRAEAELKWLVWKHEHIRTCEDLPGECCDDCHDEDEFTLTTKAGITYCLCCHRVIP